MPPTSMTWHGPRSAAAPQNTLWTPSLELMFTDSLSYFTPLGKYETDDLKGFGEEIGPGSTRFRFRRCMQKLTKNPPLGDARGYQRKRGESGGWALAEGRPQDCTRMAL